jgi:DNA (cytosine-5)-methyltransferase 1
MKYLSVCSGIEAATVAWHPLGWTPVAFAEIEKFPSAVLAHHYPHVPNLGDMTKFKDWPNADVDVLVGGTPCQSFSVAGLRKGMADPRGNLALTYLAIADRYRPKWVLWENVPGILSSSKGRDFGAFLGGLAELGYGFAYRVLDAQYVRVDGFGRAVPQRRRRVFVVGHLGDWRRAAAVLFERESLSWNSAPSREAGQGVAPTISARPTGGGGLGTDFDLDGGLIASTGNVAHCLNAGAMGRIDYETETMIAHALRGEGFDASEDGTGRGTPLVPVVAGTMKACKDSGGFSNSADHAAAGYMIPIAIQERAISENAAAGPDGVGVRDDGAAYTLEARQVPQAVAYDLRGREDGSQFEGPRETVNIRAASGGSSRSYIAQSWAVRRLIPEECEALQAFTRGYTNIPWRGKPTAPDGPRYKALGNSMAVNVMRWLGHRINHVSKLVLEAS